MHKKALNKKIFFTVVLSSCLVAGLAFAGTKENNKLKPLPMGSWTGIGTDIVNGSNTTPKPTPPTISKDILKMSAADQKRNAINNAAVKIGPAIVGVSIYNGSAWVFSGSGVIYDAMAGLLVTNAHVVGENNTVQIILNDRRSFKGFVVGKDTTSDLAVVKMVASDLIAAEFGDSSLVGRGEIAIVMGIPLGMDYQSSINAGVISGLNRHLDQDNEGLNLLQTDTPINPGNSGGALVNSRGQVIGINISKLGHAEGIGFAIPINTVKLVVDKLTSEGKLQQTLDQEKTEVSSIKDAIEIVSPSIVGVSKKNKDGQTALSASGVVYDSTEGYILTSYTGIKDAESVVVSLEDGRSFTGEIIGSAADCNLAVLKIQASNLKQPTFGDSALLRRGDTAIVIGSSVGLELSGSVTVGIISGLNRLQQVGAKSYSLIQTDAALNEGNGGSALVNEYGQIVGINIAKPDRDNTERIGFAIPMNTARKYVDDIIRQATGGKPYLGMNVAEQITVKSGKAKGRSGMSVLAIMDKSPVAKAGLQLDDIVLSINGQAVSLVAEVAQVLSKHKAGDTISLEIYRDNKPMTLKVLLEALPD